MAISIAAVILQLLLASSTLLVVQFLWTYFYSPLKNIPGPFIAQFTNLWRFLDVWGGRSELTQKSLHDKYGAAVRLGPNVVSLNDPRLIKSIYSTRGEYLKSDFYTVNHVKNGKQIIENLFGTKSNSFHDQQVKPIQRHYTMNSLLDFEPLVDKTIGTFTQKLDSNFVETGKICSIDDWLLYFAWDVIGEITFSQPMGFLETGNDVDHILSGANKSLDYFATIGQIPSLDALLDKNPIHRIGPPSFGAVVGISAMRAMGRISGSDGHAVLGQKDFLDRFLEKKLEHPDFVDDNQVVGWLCINMFAGADTTGITLRAILYYVLKNPRVHRRLQKELDAAGLKMPVSYKVAQGLPYLMAVIQEATRMHPGVGLPLERVVPAQGLTLADGRFIKPGTIVGMNAWVVHQNKEVFGQDAASFVPERWLRDKEESDEAFQQRRSRMREADLTFGAGKRVCLGKNVSLLETYKIIATLFLLYDMSFVDPAKEWTIQNSWFVRQSGMDITMKRRK